MTPSIGSDAYALLEWSLKRLKGVDSVEFVQFKPAPSVVERNEQSHNSFRLTAVGRPEHLLWVPLHEAVVINSVEQSSLSDNALDKMVWHDETGDDQVRTLVKRDALDSKLVKAIVSKQPNWVLAISSRVQLKSGEHGHFPLMDFQCPAKDPKYLPAVVAAMKAIGQKDGAVLNSGNSFHYCGLELLSHSQWQRFLGKCLLLTPLTDTRYIGHRIISGECTLRLLGTQSRPAPKIVARL